MVNPIDNNLTDEENISRLTFRIVVVTAIGYVIAMTWSDFIQLGINKIYPVSSNNKFTDRLLLTIAITIGLFFIAYLLLKLEKYVKKTEKNMSN